MKSPGIRHAKSTDPCDGKAAAGYGTPLKRDGSHPAPLAVRFPGSPVAASSTVTTGRLGEHGLSGPRLCVFRKGCPPTRLKDGPYHDRCVPWGRPKHHGRDAFLRTVASSCAPTALGHRAARRGRPGSLSVSRRALSDDLRIPGEGTRPLITSSLLEPTVPSGKPG
jgi:hypothetical protein